MRYINLTVTCFRMTSNFITSASKSEWTVLYASLKLWLFVAVSGTPACGCLYLPILVPFNTPNLSFNKYIPLNCLLINWIKLINVTITFKGTFINSNYIKYSSQTYQIQHYATNHTKYVFLFSILKSVIFTIMNVLMHF